MGGGGARRRGSLGGGGPLDPATCPATRRAVAPTDGTPRPGLDDRPAALCHRRRRTSCAARRRRATRGRPSFDPGSPPGTGDRPPGAGLHTPAPMPAPAALGSARSRTNRLASARRGRLPGRGRRSSPRDPRPARSSRLPDSGPVRRRRDAAPSPRPTRPRCEATEAHDHGRPLSDARQLFHQGPDRRSATVPRRRVGTARPVDAMAAGPWHGARPAGRRRGRVRIRRSAPEATPRPGVGSPGVPRPPGRGLRGRGWRRGRRGRRPRPARRATRHHRPRAARCRR